MADHVLIIGVGAGIGASLARRAAAEGARVTLVARSERVTGPLVQQLQADGVDAAAVVVDAAYEPAFTATLEQVIAERGAPRLVVYNAVDPTPAGPASTLDPEGLTMALETNVTGAVVVTNAVLEPMRAAGGGTIIFTGGVLATRPFAPMTSLSIGKAALRSYALCLHQELGTDDPVHAVTVTIGGMVEPGTAFDPDAIAERMFDVHARRDRGRLGEVAYDGPVPAPA